MTIKARLPEAPSRRSPIPLLNLPSMLLFVFATLALIGSAGMLDRDYEVFWLAVSLSCYLAGLFFVVFSRTQGFGLGIFRLGPWFLGYAVVAYGLASLTLVAPLDPSLWVIDKSSYPAAFAVVAAGFTTWSIGYTLGPASILNRAFSSGRDLIARGLSESIRAPEALLSLFILAIGADLFSIVVDGRFGYLGDATNVTVESVQWYGQLLSILSNLKYVALFGASVRVYVQKKDTAPRLLLPLTLITLIWGLMTGMKESFVTCLISIAVPYFIAKGKLRVVPIVLTMIIFVMVVAPAVTALRQDVRGERGPMDVNAALAVASERIFSADTYLRSNVVNSGDYSIASRVRLVDNMAVIIQMTPSQISFRSFDELAAAPVSALIPRVFWPEKPIQISGYDFYRNYYGGLAKSSSAITLPGSLYLYGGVLVVIVGMFICGVLLRGLDEAVNARSSMKGALFVTIAFPIIVKQEMDVSTFLATIPVLIVTWIIGSRCIFTVHKDRRNDSGS